MTLRNVDTGVEVEKSYTGATVNPTSKPHQWLVDAGVTDSTGMVDVNKYTLQHQRFENIFAFLIFFKIKCVYLGMNQMLPL